MNISNTVSKIYFEDELAKYSGEIDNKISQYILDHQTEQDNICKIFIIYYQDLVLYNLENFLSKLSLSFNLDTLKSYFYKFLQETKIDEYKNIILQILNMLFIFNSFYRELANLSCSVYEKANEIEKLKQNIKNLEQQIEENKREMSVLTQQVNYYISLK